MRFKQVGNKNDILSVVVKSAETTSTIAAGNPVALVMNGTNDGLAVVLPATATAAKAHSLAFGVAHNPISPAAYGETQVWGFCQRAKYSRIRTRANSTTAYASTAAVAVGDILNIDTVQNGFQPAGAQAVSAYLPAAVVAETLASLDSVATSDISLSTATVSYSTGFLKVFLRMM